MPVSSLKLHPLATPIKAKSLCNNINEDDSTLGTTPSSNCSLCTPSTISASPGRHIWSLSPKKHRCDNNNIATESQGIIDADRLSPPRIQSSKHTSPFHIQRRNEPSITPTPVQNTNKRSTPALIHCVINSKTTNSILDLACNEDNIEVSLVVNDTSFRHYIQDTNHTFTYGKIKSLHELPREEIDQDDDGLNNEVNQLHINEAKCKLEINLAMDMLAYRHPSTADWWSRNVISRHDKRNDESKTDRFNDDEHESLTDKLIGICSACCGSSL